MNFWCYINVSSIFSMFFTLKPATFHLLNINDSSMKHRWIINETKMNHRWRKSYLYMFYGWIQTNEISNSSYQIIISNHIGRKYLPEIWIERQKSSKSNFDRENFDCSSQNWFLSVQRNIFGWNNFIIPNLFRTLPKKILAGVLETELYVSRRTFWSIFFP